MYVKNHQTCFFLSQVQMTVITEVVPGRGHAVATRAKTKSGPVTEVSVAAQRDGGRGTGQAKARSGPRGHGQDLKRSRKRSVVEFFCTYLYFSPRKSIHTPSHTLNMLLHCLYIIHL